MEEGSFADRLARSFAAVVEGLPAGWELSLRCASTGLAPDQRSSDWVARADGPEHTVIEGRGQDPERALADLRVQLGRRPNAS